MLCVIADLMMVTRYPKDSDKITLARQTGLTRSQVIVLLLILAVVKLWGVYIHIHPEIS